jgi:hypothetical protein
MGLVLDLVKQQAELSVEGYSQRRLGVPADKLPALSGIASRYHEHLLSLEEDRNFSIQFFAGMFSTDILRQLYWHTKTYAHSQMENAPPLTEGEDELRRSETYRAPSWSWASIDGPVVYEDWNILPSDAHIDLHQYREGHFAKFEAIRTEPTVNAAPYGSLKSATLEIQARVIIVADGWELKTSYSAFRVAHKRYNIRFYLWPDTAEDAIDLRNGFKTGIAYFLELSDIELYHYQDEVSEIKIGGKELPRTVRGLILLRIKKHNNRFRRIGIFSSTDKNNSHFSQAKLYRPPMVNIFDRENPQVVELV